MTAKINLINSILSVAAATLAILLIPYIAMKFTTEVNWSAFDFIIAGILLFGTGLAFVFLIAKGGNNILSKVGYTLAIGTTFLLIWANLAVGLIGSGPHAGNLMFIGVLAVVIIGTHRSRFTPSGMEVAMFASAISVVLVAAIALITNMDQYPGSSVVEIIGVCTFFATLYAIAGMLFRFVALQSTTENSK